MAKGTHGKELFLAGLSCKPSFCGSGRANMDLGRFKTAYLKAAAEASTDPFADVVQIFEEFSARPVA